MVRLIKNHQEFKLVCSADLRDHGDSQTQLTANGINSLYLSVAGIMGSNKSQRFAISFNEGFLLCKERAKALHQLLIEDENVKGHYVRRDGSEFLFRNKVGCIIILYFANCVQSQFFVDPQSEDSHWLTSPTKQEPIVIIDEDGATESAAGVDDAAESAAGADDTAESAAGADDATEFAAGVTFDEESTAGGEAKIGLAEAPKRDKSRRKIQARDSHEA